MSWWLLAPILPALADEPVGEGEASSSSGVSVTVTDDVEIRYWVRPERVPGFPDRPVFNYVEQVNRLNLSVSAGRWSGFVQVDEVVLAANRYQLDGVIHHERELVRDDVFAPLPGFAYANPEKVQLAWEGDAVAVTLGDFYATFGNGIALNLGRNVGVDIDTSIQGARVLWHGPLWEATVLVGQLNRQQVQQDNPNVRIGGDRRHLVSGVRVDRYGLGPASLGAHAVSVAFVDDPGWGGAFSGVDSLDAVVGGVSGELYGVGGLDWVAEADVFSYALGDIVTADGARTGHALYGSATAYVGETTWQLEVKRYRNTEGINGPLGGEQYEMAIGPTLEVDRAITEDSSAALNSNDIVGARLRGDWALRPGRLVPYASVGVFRDWDTGALHFNQVPETVLHPMVGVEAFGDEVSAIVNVGHRFDIRDAKAAGVDRQLYADWDVKVPILAGLHLDLAGQGEWYRWGNNPLRQSDYLEFNTSLTALHGSDWAVTWYTDFTDNPLVSGSGNLCPGGDGERRCPVYGALEVQVKPMDALTVKLLGGALKAGLRCAGGQCRVLPGFEGVRLAATGTF